jgi:hypothetical protein
LYNNATVNDKHGFFNANAHKRTETGFLGVFPSNGHGYTISQSKRLETAFPAQETTNQRNDKPAKQRKQL